jgi:hypothetical protein
VEGLAEVGEVVVEVHQHAAERPGGHVVAVVNSCSGKGEGRGSCVRGESVSIRNPIVVPQQEGTPSTQAVWSFTTSRDEPFSSIPRDGRAITSLNASG